MTSNLGRASRVGAVLALTLTLIVTAQTAEGVRCTRGVEATGLSARCQDVRPGTYVLPNGCTLGFLFRGSDGARYFSTAGHCAVVGPDERTWAEGQGPWVMGVESGERIGEFAYAIVDYRHPPTKDFALLRVDPDVEASPSVCYWGGPVGMSTGTYSSPQWVRFYGNGVGVSRLSHARTGYAMNMSNPEDAWFLGPTAPGDSGGPVLTESVEALGLIVASSVAASPSPLWVGNANMIRLRPAVDRAVATLGIGLTLELG